MTPNHQPNRPAANWPQTISIIGAAGLVGSTVAAQLALNGIGQNIYLQDRKSNVLEAHRIDLDDAKTITGVDSPSLHLGPPADGEADIVIVAASISEVPDGDRRGFLNGNAQILEALAKDIESQVSDTGLVLILSNPVDVLAHWLHEITDLDPTRILGYALNDSARFQAAVARELGVKKSEVSGVVYGEHGRGQVPIFSSIRVRNQTVKLETSQEKRILQSIEGWFERWSNLQSGRSSGWATGVGTLQLIKQLMVGQETVATAYTGAVPELSKTFMALPIARECDAIQLRQLDVTADELAKLQTAAKSIKKVARKISS
ncbi:MAG TPA: hypothetical protein VIG71_12110 [Enteractinococcus sp.]